MALNLIKGISLYILHLLSQLSSWSNNFIKDVFPHMWIDSAEWIIQQIDISIKIHWTRQAHSLFLSSTQVYALKKINIYFSIFLKVYK